MQKLNTLLSRLPSSIILAGLSVILLNLSFIIADYVSPADPSVRDLNTSVLALTSVVFFVSSLLIITPVLLRLFTKDDSADPQPSRTATLIVGTGVIVTALWELLTLPSLDLISVALPLIQIVYAGVLIRQMFQSKAREAH